MTRSSHRPIVVVGGGLVGLATALSLRRETSADVLLLEAEQSLASQQSGHNSGVLHSGLYYAPGSLKAELCRAGREEVIRLCESEGVAWQRSGKLVVATTEAELPALAELERRGRQNGLGSVESLAPDGIRRREPQACGIAGLWVGETGVVDFTGVAGVLARQLQDRGGEIRTGWRFLGLRSADPMVLETTRGAVEAAGLIACAGLYGDRVARSCGVDPGVDVVPFRGEYYLLRPAAAALVRGLIYPVPDPRFPFLGVHLTRTVDGRVEAGPNAVLALSRRGYRWRDVNLADVGSTLRSTGFRLLARRYWRTGVMEVARSMSRARFAASLRRLVPAITTADLVRGGSGVRAQAVDAAGRLLDDFHVVRATGMLHVLNAPSPAATASPAIGRHLSRLAREHLDLGRR